MKKDKRNKENSSFVFDAIAGIYALFYKYQKGKFESAVSSARPFFDISGYGNALDAGCGTGALCDVFSRCGLNMTGVDNSKQMLKIASRKHANQPIDFIYHDATKPLPFPDNSFDFSIASYVAHGLNPSERKKMLLEMRRVSKHYVILHEYGKKRKPLTDIIEWLEGGNYFVFIKNIESELNEIFREVQIIEVGPNGYWYICKA